jgi:hypothetical protein
VKEIKQLGEHGEEANWKITELEALCKKHDEDAQKLRKENAKLEGMVESHDELIMEFVDKFVYNCMDEGADDEDDWFAKSNLMVIYSHFSSLFLDDTEAYGKEAHSCATATECHAYRVS